MKRQYLSFGLYFGADEHGPYCGIESRPCLPTGFDVLNANNYDGIILNRVNMVTLKYSAEFVRKINQSLMIGENDSFFTDKFRGNAPI